MEEKATEILDLVKEGVTQLGTVAPQVWELMVWYHWAQHLAYLTVYPLLGVAVAAWGVKTCREGWKRPGEDGLGMFVAGAAATVLGGISFLFGIVDNFADVMVPEAGLILDLVKGGK